MPRRPKDAVKRAAKGYADFTGAKASKVSRAKLPDADQVGWKMGPAVGVAYEATRDGETERYFHEFGKKARPDLIAADDGRQLYFSGGRYKVTERGIEDMPQLFVVNPSQRPSRVGRKSKGKSMARRRTHRRRRSTRQTAIFRANPIRRRRRSVRRARVHHRRRRALPMLANPVRRRRRSYRRNPVARRRSYRRNPSLRGGASTFMKFLVPAAGIGAGAVGTEIILGYLPIPAQFKTGIARHVTKGVVGVAAGLVLGKLFRMKRLGNYFALGAVAIAVHDALKEAIASNMPSVKMAQYRRPIRGSFAGMGYSNPAMTARLGQYVSPVASSIGPKCGETNFAA